MSTFTQTRYLYLIKSLPFSQLFDQITDMNYINGSLQPTCKPVTHIIFDLDGLLLSKYTYFGLTCSWKWSSIDFFIVDSEECYHKIDEAVIGKYGKKVPDDLFLQILGFSDIDCARKIIEICDLPTTPKQYQSEVLHHTYLLRDVKLLPGKFFFLIQIWSFEKLFDFYFNYFCSIFCMIIFFWKIVLSMNF